MRKAVPLVILVLVKHSKVKKCQQQHHDHHQLLPSHLNGIARSIARGGGGSQHHGPNQNQIGRDGKPFSEVIGKSGTHAAMIGPKTVSRKRS